MTPGESLVTTGVAVRPAEPGDEVAGVAPRWVATPETTGEAALVMRAAADHGLAVTPVGGGTKLSWGHPPARCDLVLDTRRLARVLEHEAGDLVARVQAGITADALAAALGAAGQRLALDFTTGGSTVGGALATAAAGPGRLRHGTARDLLIGVTVVLADGTVARAGGKVVKNVAGYDLGKLFTGSLGTLGLITEATFRLHPLPTARAWITATSPGPGVVAAVARLATSPLEPSAIELDSPGVRAPVTVAALVEGVAAGERAEDAARLLGDTARISADPPAWWGRLPGQAAPGAGPAGYLLELRVPPAAAVTAPAAAGRAAGAAGLDAHIRGSAATCVLYAALPPDTPPGAAEIFVTSLRTELSAAGGRLVVWTAPPEAARIDRFGPVGSAALMRRVKERFDPEGRMSPGRLTGGAARAGA
ncbi:glycolate oxidase [Sphaerisporangium siamense]|uniref:Glycolate oxidase FAD binding subunit n=1 Tax=Sphaerisporangium siamense TaxID=795645 RepID=A0A7W7GDU3_9ACTN|nr:FAD-binding oxidoreductase [Sphaerisporangium siamense]MBB4705355.1 glycolate oxidase FAD binding subunit [Sphaerisporangium siamense]GII86493.1 glycolate oxidase [Sphaerisporangium siamense]